MSNILNLTQHAATPDQVQAGVVEPADKPAVSTLLTFDTAPDQGELQRRASALAAMATNAGTPAAMIGGAPYLMAPLEKALREAGVKPVYSFSERRSSEQTQPDGSVRKVNVFVHVGWVEA
ncbi:MAG: hypothetical protein AAB605_02495 [Patescibacteria group bacterium]